MSNFHKIDDIDRKILGILQKDSSLTISDIADKVGLSTNPCWRRIQRLESDGIIQRKVAILDPAALGLAMTVFVTVKTTRHDSEWLTAFISAVKKIPEIVECHRMSGDIDYQMKVLVRDIDHYDRVYKRLIDLVPSLADVSSAFSMERIKQETAIDLGTV